MSIATNQDFTMALSLKLLLTYEMVYQDQMEQILPSSKGRICFSADDGIHGRELWVYDGINATLVQDYEQGSIGTDPTQLIVFNNKLFSLAFDPTQELNCAR